MPSHLVNFKRKATELRKLVVTIYKPASSGSGTDVVIEVIRCIASITCCQAISWLLSGRQSEIFGMVVVNRIIDFEPATGKSVVVGYGDRGNASGP